VRTSGIGPFFAIAFGAELAQGLGGFFSDFKTVFLFTLLAAAASGKRFSPRTIFGLGTLVALLILFGIVWNAVKGDYRTFVAGGDEKSQAVVVNYGDAVAKLAELIGGLDSEALVKSSKTVVERLTYVELFGIVIDYVPSILPHENGALMWDAIRRPFMPRILFSDKSAIDDTERTNLYTGGVAGNYAGTSISLGWIAEAYIDFGEYLMVTAILLIGYFYGRLYRWYLGGPATKGLLGFAFIPTVLMQASLLESSFTKVFGGVVVSCLIVWLIGKFAVQRWCPWLVPTAPR
jgi:hypothetical protein